MNNNDIEEMMLWSEPPFGITAYRSLSIMTTFFWLDDYIVDDDVPVQNKRKIEKKYERIEHGLHGWNG